MTKALTILLFSLVLPCLVFSQDIVQLKSGDLIKAKIIEIGPEMIKYKKESNPDGPTYLVKKEDVVKVQFANGDSEEFSKESSTPKAKPKGDVPEYGNNIITVNLVNPIFDMASLAYERILANGKIGIKIPLTYGWVNRYAAAGLDLNFYIAGQNRWSYFLGPSLSGGVADYPKLTSWSVGTVQTTIIGAYFNNGVNFMATKGLFVGANAGIGAIMLPNYGKTFYVDLDYIVGLNIGGRF